MKNFEEKKQEHRTALMMNPELIEKAREMLKPDAFQIFINPVTGSQLEYVIALSKIISEYILIEAAEEICVEYENNALTMLFVDAITAFREDKKFDLQEYFDNISADAKGEAKLYYDMACSKNMDYDELTKCIIDKLNITDPADMLSLFGYLIKLIGSFNSTTLSTTDLSNVTEKDAIKMNEVANEFHKLYEAGMKKSDDKTIGTK